MYKKEKKARLASSISNSRSPLPSFSSFNFHRFHLDELKPIVYTSRFIYIYKTKLRDDLNHKRN